MLYTKIFMRVCFDWVKLAVNFVFLIIQQKTEVVESLNNFVLVEWMFFVQICWLYLYTVPTPTSWKFTSYFLQIFHF